MESIGPNEEKGDVFLYLNQDAHGYKCMGIILSMESIMSTCGVPCNFAQVECLRLKKLLGIELQWHKHSPIMMGPSKNGQEGFMVKMGWEIPKFSQRIVDFGLSSCEDIVEGLNWSKQSRLKKEESILLRLILV